MARRGKRGVLGWILLLGILALAGFGVYKAVETPAGKQAVRAVKAGSKAAAKAYNGR
jgi:hypothetical protein